MRTLAAACVLFLLPGLSSAQESPDADLGPQYLVTVHGISQRATSNARASLTFAEYDETATAEFSQHYKPGTGYWIAGGYRVWRRAYVGLGFSQTTSKATGTVALSVPHPLLYDAPRSGTDTIDGATQRAQAVHLWAGWRIPLLDRVDLLASLGPSFVTIKRDVATAVGYAETSAPYTTIVITNPTVTRRSRSVVGFQVGGEVGVRLTSNVDASAGIRYLHANATIDNATGSSKAKAGGLVAGGGVRLNF